MEEGVLSAPEKTTAIIVDNSNLFDSTYELRRRYGNFDLEKLAAVLSNGNKVIYKKCFLADKPDANLSGLESFLQSKGWLIKKKPAKEIKKDDGTVYHKCNMDVNIIQDYYEDLVMKSKKPDIIIFVSGDSDFSDVIIAMRVHGSQVIAVGVNSSFSYDVKLVANSYIAINTIYSRIIKP